MINTNLGGVGEIRVFSSKVNVTARLELELINYDVAVQNVSHYIPETPYRNGI